MRALQTGNAGWPGGEVLMAHDDSRSTGRDVVETTRTPVSDCRRLVRGHVRGRLRPTLDQGSLHVTLAGAQYPVAWLAGHAVFNRGETPFGACRRVRPRCQAAQSLVRVLVAIHQLTHHLVFGLSRSTCEMAVVRDGEQHDCALSVAMGGERPQPRFRYEIEQRRRGN